MIVALATPVLLGVTGCTKGEPSEAGESRAPSDWAKLPAVTSTDAELGPLGSRQATLDRVCGRKRGDAFSKVLCGAGGRPEIRDFAELLELVGLNEQRAFALTGNSTSLLARNVSALNPRILVFPRVDDDLRRPDAMTAVGFVRGEQLVELVSRDPSSNDLQLLSAELRAILQLPSRRLRSGGAPHRGGRTRLDCVQRLRSGRPRRHVSRLQLMPPTERLRNEAHAPHARARESLAALVSAAVRAKN